MQTPSSNFLIKHYTALNFSPRRLSSSRLKHQRYACHNKNNQDFGWINELLTTRQKCSPSAAFSEATGILITILNPYGLSSDVDNPRHNIF